MKKRPILFSGPMVRAILDGRKTQTRRVVKPYLRSESDGSKRRVLSLPRDLDVLNEFLKHRRSSPLFRFCPFGQPGDRLWVKETHAFYGLNFCDLGVWHPIDRDVCCHFREGCPVALEDRIEKWRPSIHMPRWASRITLEITGVRVERLQEISEEDARREGIPHDKWSFPQSTKPMRTGFEVVWESINGPGSWNANPWVWVIEFGRVKL